MKIKDLQVQYITNPDGEKTAVVLPLDVFQELLECSVDFLEVGDPDAGLELRADIRARLEQQQQAVKAGERGESLDAVRQRLGL